MAKIKVNHFGAKTVGLNRTVDWEIILTEVFIALFLGVFAFMGYVAKIPLLLFPCAIGSALCIYASLQTIYTVIKEHRTNNSE
jgi:hypothetical protein